MKRMDDELTNEQNEQLDEIYNLIFELCKVMTALPDADNAGINEPCIEWDMEYIGEIADAAQDILYSEGYPVYYPWIGEDDEGNACTYDFVGEDEENG